MQCCSSWVGKQKTGRLLQQAEVEAQAKKKRKKGRKQLPRHAAQQQQLTSPVA